MQRKNGENGMKNESKRAVTKHVSYIVILSLANWSLGSAMADDKVVQPPAAVTAPVVVPVDADNDAAEDAATVGSNPAKDAERVTQLATEYGVTEQQVVTMRQTEHMGWGEIRNLLLISQRIAADSVGSANPLTNDQALAQVLKQRLSGMGIGQIANSYKLKLGDLQHADKLNRNAKHEGIDKPGKTDRPEKLARPDRPDKPVKPAKPDRPDKPEKPAKMNKPDKGN